MFFLQTIATFSFSFKVDHWLKL